MTFRMDLGAHFGKDSGEIVNIEDPAFGGICVICKEFFTNDQTEAYLTENKERKKRFLEYKKEASKERTSRIGGSAETNGYKDGVSDDDSSREGDETGKSGSGSKR